MDRFEGFEGEFVKVTTNDGQVYKAKVRSVHDDGVTLWMDPEKEDEGEVRTVVGAGKHKNATVKRA